MNAEMKQAEKAITGMEKWCGICVCPWKKTRKVRDNSDGYWKKDDSSSKGEKSKGKKKEPKEGQAAPQGPYVNRITNDAREDEMEENMQNVGQILGNLKAMASDMGEEVDKQNKQIDRIGAKVGLLHFLFIFYFS